MNRSLRLQEAIEGVGKEFFSAYPQVPHSWNIGEDGFELSIVTDDESGFSIFVELNHNEAIIHCECAHQHIHWPEEENARDYAKRIYGIIYDYLTTKTRLREVYSGKNPYKYVIEQNVNGEWEREEEMGLLFFNYFGRRSKKFYQNDILPPRYKQCQQVDESNVDR